MTEHNITAALCSGTFKVHHEAEKNPFLLISIKDTEHLGLLTRYINGYGGKKKIKKRKKESPGINITDMMIIQDARFHQQDPCPQRRFRSFQLKSAIP